MDGISIVEQKRAIRKLMAQRKRSVDFSSRVDMSREIWRKIEGLPEFVAAKVVLMYHALPDEVRTAEFLDKWYKDKTILLPLVVGDDLELKVYDPGHIVPGYKGIPEPTSNAVTVNPQDVDFAIIPGVAFDPECNRLGRGKGFYDRLLPHLGCKLAGLGFDFQVVDKVPVEIFDRKLDMVITEERLFDRL